MKISIYGTGNFGFAMLKYLDSCSVGKAVELHVFDRDESVRTKIRLNRNHPTQHLGIKISKRVSVSDDPAALLDQCDILILCVTSSSTREVINTIKPLINRNIIILNTAKALDFKTGRRLSELVLDSLGDLNYKVSYACLSGGMIAGDVVKIDPLGADVASKGKTTLKILKGLLSTSSLRIYPTADLAGVEYAGAFKNVISILSGIMNGIGFTYGSETYIISRASNEAQKLAVKLGANKDTFSSFSQSWGNDMVMSATGNTRNREFGILLGKGYRVSRALEIMRKKNKTVEGVNTVKVLRKLIGNRRNEFPIFYRLGSLILDNDGARTKKFVIDLVDSGLI